MNYQSLPNIINVGGIPWTLEPAIHVDPGIEYSRNTIYYPEDSAIAHTVSEILGYVLEIMLHQTGTSNSKTKKINVGIDQLTNALKYNMFCFLRDNNHFDWSKLTNTFPLLEDKQIDLYEEEVPVIKREHQNISDIDAMTKDFEEKLNKLSDEDDEDFFRKSL